MTRRRTHLLLIFGTRPEAIKLAPVAAGLRAAGGSFRVTLAATGQHRGLLDQALAATGLRLDWDLHLMRSGQSLTSLLAAALSGLDALLARLRPDGVIVQGDTTTAVAGALAAFHRGLPVGHVEAGLRTHDLTNPFPEEANRRLIAGLAAWHFAPTPRAVANLRAEGVAADRIFLTGNPVVDALRSLRDPGFDPAAHGFAFRTGQTRRVLVTAHRRESFGRPLREICAALGAAARRHPETQFVFPVHPNPAVRRAVQAELARPESNLRLARPLDYRVFLNLLAGADLAVTDSGGVQEEAAVLGVPALILRTVTERPEVLRRGGRLVAPERRGVLAAITGALARYPESGARPCPFGDGRAGVRIARILAWAFAHRRSVPAPYRPGR